MGVGRMEGKRRMKEEERENGGVEGYQGEEEGGRGMEEGSESKGVNGGADQCRVLEPQ